MKTKILLISIFLVSGIFTNSCKKDLLEKDISIMLEQELTVITADTVYSVQQILDAAAQNADINEYKDKIKEITLNKVGYYLSFFSGPADQDIISAVLNVANPDGTGATGISSLSNVNLMSIAATEQTLPISTAGVTLFGNLIGNEPNKAMISFNGNVNKGPLDFKVMFKFYVTIKVKIA